MSKKRRNEGITDEMVLEKFRNGMRTAEIAEWMGVTERGVRDLLYRNGVAKIERKRRYKVNDSYFKVWSHDMAYVLGFILTDGCIMDGTDKKGMKVLSVSQKETKILQDILDSMDSNYKIYSKKEPSEVHTFAIRSDEIVDDLAKLGITARKSLIVEMPDVPKEFIHDFVRGVIDGDGHVARRNGNYDVVVTSASESFSCQFLELLLELGFESGKIRNNGAYRVGTSRKEDFKKMYEFLYQKEDCLCLERKKETFEKVIEEWFDN